MKSYKIEIIIICIFIAFVSFTTGYFFGRRDIGDAFAVSTEISENADAKKTADAAVSKNTDAKTADAAVQTANAAAQTADKPEKKININTADAKELENLPKIGEVLAQRIIDYREQIGKFKEIGGIKEVKGIGDSIYEAIKGLIDIE